jgi:hypothetical protein
MLVSGKAILYSLLLAVLTLVTAAASPSAGPSAPREADLIVVVTVDTAVGRDYTDALFDYWGWA